MIAKSMFRSQGKCEYLKQQAKMLVLDRRIHVEYVFQPVEVARPFSLVYILLSIHYYNQYHESTHILADKHTFKHTQCC